MASLLFVDYTRSRAPVLSSKEQEWRSDESTEDFFFPVGTPGFMLCPKTSLRFDFLSAQCPQLESGR